LWRITSDIQAKCSAGGAITSEENSCSNSSTEEPPQEEEEKEVLTTTTDQNQPLAEETNETKEDNSVQSGGGGGDTLTDQQGLELLRRSETSLVFARGGLTREFESLAAHANGRLVRLERPDVAKRTCRLALELPAKSGGGVNTAPARILTVVATFPSSYPEASPPSFVAAKGATLENTSKKRVLRTLRAAAARAAEEKRPCLEDCIRELHAVAADLAEDKMAKPFPQPGADPGDVLEGGSTLFAAVNVPFPRMSGARFGAFGKLICFAPTAHGNLPGVRSNQASLSRANGRSQLTTPRTLALFEAQQNISHQMDALALHHNGLPRISSASSLAASARLGRSGSPADTRKGRFNVRKVSTADADLRATAKAGNSAFMPAKESTESHLTPRVAIYNVENLIPVNKQLAKTYVLRENDPLSTCQHNARAALEAGVPHLAQIWMTCASMAHMEKRAAKDRASVWNGHPMGQPLLDRILKGLDRQGDVQTAAMLVCTFQRVYKPLIKTPTAKLTSPMTSSRSFPSAVLTSPTRRRSGSGDDLLSPSMASPMKASRLRTTLRVPSLPPPPPTPPPPTPLVEEPTEEAVEAVVAPSPPPPPPQAPPSSMKKSKSAKTKRGKSRFWFLSAGLPSVSSGASGSSSHSPYHTISYGAVPKVAKPEERRPLVKIFDKGSEEEEDDNLLVTRRKASRSSSWSEVAFDKLRFQPPNTLALTKGQEGERQAPPPPPPFSVLLPKRQLFYLNVQILYATVLDKWMMPLEKLAILKYVKLSPSSLITASSPASVAKALADGGVSAAVECGHCRKGDQGGCRCRSCGRAPLICAVCDLSVRGLSVTCPRGCGHGGHLRHWRRWFARSALAPCPFPGCNCQCAATEAFEADSGA
jgi:hypothetical protein